MIPTERRVDIQNAFGLSAALAGALQTGLLVAVIRAPDTAEAHAARLSLDPRAVRCVLDVLVAFEIMRRDGEVFAATPILDEIAAAPIGPDRFAALWSHVPSFLATGTPFFQMDASPAEREAVYANVVSGLARMFAPAARELAARREHAPKAVLDIGCGSGVWSLAIAERHAETRVTGLDFPDVLAAFQSRAETLGLAGRVETLPGDMHEIAIPEGAFDLVMIANVLRLEKPGRASRLVARAARAIAPGGDLVVVDALGDGSPASNRSLSVYALNLSMRTAQGRTYSMREISGWMKDSGITPTREETLPVELGPVGAVIGRKKGG